MARKHIEGSRFKGICTWGGMTVKTYPTPEEAKDAMKKKLIRFWSKTHLDKHSPIVYAVDTSGVEVK